MTKSIIHTIYIVRTIKGDKNLESDPRQTKSIKTLKRNWYCEREFYVYQKSSEMKVR